MAFRWDAREHVRHWLFFLRWLVIALPLGAAVGSAVALFLWSLEKATALRFCDHDGEWLAQWLLYVVARWGVVDRRHVFVVVGKSVEGGNNLMIDQIHEPGGGVPSRMAPLVLVATVLTHLFGGSAGREGTAVQMGGSIASWLGKVLRLEKREVRLVLMAGVASGFGAVFGTPLAGAVFAMEVLTIGQMSYAALIPCLLASIIGDQVCAAWGIHHVQYSIASFSEQAMVRGVPHFNIVLAAKVLVAAVAFGLASVLFAELTHGLGRVFKKIRWPLLRPVVDAGIID